MSASAISQINKSGFALQSAIAHKVRTQCPNWEVAYEEHAWRDEMSGESGFIDLAVVTSGGNCFLVIECKRVRDTSWIFICDSDEQLTRFRAKGWLRTERGPGYHGWADLTANRGSPESAYCVVRGDSGKTSMLERLAAEAVCSTRAFSIEQSNYFGEALADSVTTFSLIVTTAELQIAKVDPSKISLADGNISGDTEVETVPFVRFRKQLMNDPDVTVVGGPSSVALARAKEQTVFIVNAERLLDFLAEFRVDPNSVAQNL